MQPRSGNESAGGLQKCTEKATALWQTLFFLDIGNPGLRNENSSAHFL